MPAPKKVLCIQDLSSVGRCSLGVIIPSLSAMGIQVCALPTAILSTHTGGFGQVVLEDETKFLEKSLTHFKELDFHFDAVFSGYLTNASQAKSVLRAYTQQSPAPLKVCDPVLGDYGKIYAKPGLVEAMQVLVTHANVITPNPTESALLLGLPPVHETFTITSVQERLTALCKLGPSVVITGADIDGKKMCAGIDNKTGSFFTVPLHYAPVKYPGTGDLFSSVLTGSLLQGHPLEQATKAASTFVEHAVFNTYENGGEPRHGVYLESVLKELIPT